jgi:hypothetical protein
MGEIGCRTLKGVKKRKKMNLERLTLIYRGEKREREKKKKKTTSRLEGEKRISDFRI